MSHLFAYGALSLRITLTVLASALVFHALSDAHAANRCQEVLEHDVQVVAYEQPAYRAMVQRMKNCERAQAKITASFDNGLRDQMNLLASDSSQPRLMALDSSNFALFYSQKMLTQLDDLMQQFRIVYPSEPQMHIIAGAGVMAMATQVDMSVLIYRKDLLERHNLNKPTTYKQLLTVAQSLKNDPSISAPMIRSYTRGWQLGLALMDMVLANGGALFELGSAEPLFDHDPIHLALQMMEQSLKLMPQTALQADPRQVLDMLIHGQVAMAILDLGDALSLRTTKSSAITDQLQFSVMPSMRASGPPAASIRWSGWAIAPTAPQHYDDAFSVMMEGIHKTVAIEYAQAAAWLHGAYQPNAETQTVVDALAANAIVYPIGLNHSLAHKVLGDTIYDYLAGKMSKKQALAQAEQSYRALARGFKILK